MKKTEFLAVVTLILIILFATESFAQPEKGMKWYGSGGWGPGTQYGRLYNPKTVGPISGDVVSVDTITPLKGMSSGVHLMVKTGQEQYLEAKKGDRIELSAVGSTDPDGDALSYNWFCYSEAGTFSVSDALSGQPIEINNFDQQEAWFLVPTSRVMAPGVGTIHVILAVTDHGSPRLTCYKRIIINVK